MSIEYPNIPKASFGSSRPSRSPGKPSLTTTSDLVGNWFWRSPIAMLCTDPALADTTTPLSPAMDGPDPARMLTPASLAALRDIKVTPAPVSTAKVNGPTELIQVSTSNPRPWTSRNVTERGSEMVRGAVAGFALLCCAVD